MHWLFARCLHACVCVFRLLCLSTETLHRPPFYLHHSSSHLNPFIHPDPCASSFPFLFHSSNPYSHFLPLQRIHCLHNQHDFHWEVFSLHPWGLSPFSLSLSFSHILSWPPPLFRLFYGTLNLTHSFGSIFISPSLSMFLSPSVPYMQSLLCCGTLWLNIDKNSLSPNRGEAKNRTQSAGYTASFLSFLFPNLPSPFLLWRASSHLTICPGYLVRLTVPSCVCFSGCVAVSWVGLWFYLLLYMCVWVGVGDDEWALAQTSFAC